MNASNIDMNAKFRELNLGKGIIAMLILQILSVVAVKYFVSVDPYAVSSWGGMRGDYWMARWLSEVGIVFIALTVLYRAMSGKEAGKRWVTNIMTSICLVVSVATWLSLFLAAKN